MSAPPHDVILEITKIGDVQRVAAVHAPTGVEVVIQAPANAALTDVRALALRKLRCALEKKEGDTAVRPGKLV